MKVKQIMITAILLAGGLSAHAERCGDESSLQKTCESLEFKWSSEEGLQATEKIELGSKEVSALDKGACAVRHFCDGITADEAGNMTVPKGGLVITGQRMSSQEKQQLAVDCQAAIASLASNRCYSSKVWNANGGGLYDTN